MSEMIEVRGVDGRLLAQVSRDGCTLRIKRRSVVYEVDLVETWVRGTAAVQAGEKIVEKGAITVDNRACAGVE